MSNTELSQQIKECMRIRISEALKHYNKSHSKLTMHKLAQIVITKDVNPGVKASYLSSYNKGNEIRKCKPEELKRIAKKLKVSSDYLIGLTDKL